MYLNTFKAQLNARLSEFNDNEEGHVYVIGYDAKHYYQATDEARLQGCESVIVSVTCHDGVTLGSGSTQYKCRTCGGSRQSPGQLSGNPHRCLPRKNSATVPGPE